MLHRQLRNALEEIFGAEFIASALCQTALAQEVIYMRQNDFKEAVLGFQRLNFEDEQMHYASTVERDLAVALVCSLLDGDTNQLIAELGLNYIA